MPLSAQEYLDLEIRILQCVDQGYPVEITLGGQQEFPRGYLAADVVPWAASGDWVADGQRLFDKLLADSVLRGAWSEARGHSELPRRRIRLRIDPTASELHALPWELLHEGQVMLSAQVDTPFSRYLPIALRWGSAVQARPIRVLIVISNPDDLETKYGLPQADVMLEEEILETAFSMAGQQDLQVDYLDAPVTLERLEESLRTGYHLLHFLGHGAYSARRGQAALYMQDEAGHTQRVIDDEFANLLARQGVQPQLVFLAACQSATRSTADAFRGLGPKLVSAGVPAVIAMQDNVTVKSARQFSATFYRRLLEHGQVDLAVNEARSTLLTCGRPDAAVPVLFMRIKSGKLWGSEGAQEAIPARPAMPPPPEPAALPEVTSFVGREAELAYYTSKLATLRLAVITGMPGVGKTALASVLARRVCSDEKILWHSFHEDDGVEGAIWKLAGFLYWRGQKDLWEMLQGVQISGGQLPPTRNLMDYAAQMLRGKGYLLCLDDLDHLSQEGQSLIGSLVQRLTDQQTSFITTSQSVPEFVQVDDFNPLTGLSLKDTLTLLEQYGLPVDRTQDLKSQVYETQVLSKMGQQNLMSAEIAANLHACTAGNALLLILAANALKRTPSAARATFVVRLFMERDVERFLIKDIDGHLTPEERAVMSAVAVLMGAPGTRDAIETVLDGQNVRRTLTDLSERHLVNVSDSDAGREYSLNAIVRYFYYDLLSKPERQAMHRRAGTYYETEVPNVLTAARHWLRAGDYSRAAGLVTEHVGTLINQGQARALRQLLEELGAQPLAPTIRSNVHEARGDLEYLLGELDEAIRQYQVAIEVVASANALTDVRLHRKLGDVLARKGKYDEALDSVAHGRNRLTGVGEAGVEGARLAVVLGTVMLALGHYDDAATEAQAALDSLPDPSADSRSAADLHDLLGKAYFYRGDLAQSQRQFQSALELRRTGSDQRGMIKSYSNLAVIYGQQNRYADALRANEAALKIAERIGDVIALAQLYANMAADAAEQGAYDQAIEFNQRSLALCEKMGNIQGLSMARYNLGEIYQRMERFDLAADHLTRAVEFAERVGHQSGVVIGTQTLAEVYLAQGHVEEALERCRASLRQDDKLWRPSGLRLLGRIHHRLGQWQEGRLAFAEANQIWREREAWFDLAGTLLAWARLEHDAGQVSRALELGEEAVVLASQVGADDLMKQATTLLSDWESGGESGRRQK